MTATAQRAFSGGIMSPGMYGRIDIPKFQTGLKDAENLLIRAQGGIVNRAGTTLAGGHDPSTMDGQQWLVPFEFSEDDTYQLEFADAVCRVIRNGSYILNSSIAAQSVTATTTANPMQITMVDASAASNFTVGRLVFLSDPNGTSALHNTVLEVTAVSSANITFEIIGGETVDNTGDDWGSIGSGATLQEVYQFTSPYAIEDLPELYVTQDVDTLIIAHDDYDPQKLVRTADDNWAFSALTFTPEISAPTGVAVVVVVGSGGTDNRYKVSAIHEDTGEESLPSAEVNVANNMAGAAGRRNSVSWNAVTDASLYKVYKDFNGVYGFIGVTSDLDFTDENITPDTADGPQVARNPFSGSSDKPAIAAFVENRLTFAATANDPQGVEMSSSVTPFNFNASLTPAGSDGISFRMRSQKLNRVLHLIELEQPVVFTAGAEWVLRTQNDEPLAPVNFAVKPKSYRGSTTVRPALIGSTVLHVARDGNTIREFSLGDDRDQVSADVTLLARDLFEGKTVANMAYAQSPDSVVWVVFTDGSVVTLTYLEAHEVWGWTKQSFGGTDAFVHQVSVVREGAFDVPYFVVSRTIDNITITTTERLDTRQFTDVTDAYFVDCGLKYDGASTTSLRGYTHLRGESVAVLADGNVVPGISVSAQGTVTLDAASSKVAVGLSYEAYYVTLPIQFGDSVEGEGSTLGNFRAPSELSLQINKTRGISVGREGGTLDEYKQFTGDEPIPLETATITIGLEGDWEKDSSIEVRQTFPLPMHITAMAPEWTLGG